RGTRPGRFTLHKSGMLGAPVVRFPLELNIGLLRQHHRLLGEGGGVRRIVRRQGGGREQWWLGLFHEGCYTRLLQKIPWCSERWDGLTEYLPHILHNLLTPLSFRPSDLCLLEHKADMRRGRKGRHVCEVRGYLTEILHKWFSIP